LQYQTNHSHLAQHSYCPGTATSKGSLAAGEDDIHPLEIPWDNDMGDELLRVLIDKARLFEAQLWYVIKMQLNSLTH